LALEGARVRIEEDTKPVTFMKTRAAELLRRVSENRRPVVITQSGEPRGVLMDFTSYQELRRATLLLRLLAQGEADVRAKKTVPQDRVFSEIRSQLKQK
jgi:prevent-host-death family protein